MRVTYDSGSLRYLAALFLLLASCSILYDLSPDQCELSSDCASFGTGYTCEAGLCKAPAGQGGSGGTSTGGALNSGGGTSNGGTGGGVGTGGRNTAGGGAGGDEGGSSGNVGEAGAGGAPQPECTTTPECEAIYGELDPRTCVDGKCEPVPPECETHADCFVTYGETEPLACAKGRCVPLITPECPIVLPRLGGDDDIYSLLKRSNALVVGAFTFISPSALDGITVRNYDMVLQDFFQKANGLPIGKERRDVAMVVCYSNDIDSAGLMTAGRHLAYDLDVPAILAALPADDTQRLFETFRSERGKNVFFLMPNYTDETLINLEDDGLIWHMLSGADSLSVTYKPLLDLTDTHLRNSQVLGATDDLKVALITATDERFLNDLGASIRDKIRFNGDKTAAQNSPTNFIEEGTISYSTDTSHTYDQGPMVNRILAFAPHVVIGATDSDMVDKIIPLIESKWASTVGTQPKPFYMLSPFPYNTSYLSQLSASVRARLVGVNWPAAEDRTLYESYLDRYQLLFNRRDEGYENYYDAAYYLMYAITGGGTGQATSIPDGFTRLLKGTAYQVGQPDMATLLTALNKPMGDVRLVGTMGPPNWTVRTGGRADAGSVWCLNGSGTQFSDVLRYDPVSETLKGTFPCFQFPKSP